MYCRNCGTKIDEEHAFFDAYGTKIRSDGIILPNAISNAPILNPTGVQGQVAQSKYIITSIGVAVVFALFLMDSFIVCIMG